MSDEEILQLLEAREQRRYAGVAENTANLMMGDFRVVGEEMLSTIGEHQSETSHLVRAVEELSERMEEISDRMNYTEIQLDALPTNFDPADPMSMEHTLAAVLRARQTGVIPLSMRIAELTETDIDAVEGVINSTLDIFSYVENRRELAAWEGVLAAVDKDKSEFVSAVRRVVAAHENSDPPSPLSLREWGARFNRERSPTRDHH